MCVCFTRKFKVTEAGPPPDVNEAFFKYTDGGTHMSAEQLRRFLMEVQGDGGVSIADAEKIVDQVLQKMHHIAKFTRRTLTLDDFHHFLFSADLNPPVGDQVIGFFFSFFFPQFVCLSYQILEERSNSSNAQKQISPSV
jgi:phosphatidylinositol phospholipase C delta